MSSLFTKPTLTDEQLLAEVEDLLRTAPASSGELCSETSENFSWLGRLAAAITTWNSSKANVDLTLAMRDFRSTGRGNASNTGWMNLMTLLHQARHDLRMKTVGPMNVAIGAGMTFDYFDEIRKLAETARTDLFFIDPYLDADFVARYLGHSPPGIAIRLLTGDKKLLSLVPAAKQFSQQYQRPIAIRSNATFHDRYVIVDGTQCYQSGASFKDGGKAPTTLTQITDAFAAVQGTYEDLWSRAKVEL